MINDKQRREAARELRQFLSVSPNERAWDNDGLQTVGRLVGTSVGENILARLADLIDRPTCRDVGGSYAFRCSECGCVLDRYKAGNGYADDGVMSQGGDYVYAPRYCPWCGKEIEND